MRRIAGLLALVLGATMLSYGQDKGQDKSKGSEMTGWICSSKCVKQNAGVAACDANCTDKSGDAVFVDDQGKVTKIANPKKVKKEMGKKVKVRGEMMKDKDMMEVIDVFHLGAG
jgi:hypothetical protein